MDAMADEDDPRAVKADHEFLRDRTIAIVVGSGEAKKIFDIHSGLLRQRSRYFQRLPPNLKTHTLPTESPEIFELYQEYIYTGRIPCKVTGEFEIVDDYFVAPQYSYYYQDSRLADFYWLADVLEDQPAMHASLRAILASFRDYKYRKSTNGSITSNSIMEELSSGKSRRSPLYRLFIDMFVWDASPSDEFGLLPQVIPWDIARTALKYLREGRDWNEVWKTATCCDYHERSDGKKCQTRKRKRDEE